MQLLSLAPEVFHDDPLLNFVTHERDAEERGDDHHSLRPPHKQRSQATICHRFLERGQDGKLHIVAALNLRLDDIEGGGQVGCGAAADKARQHGVLKRDEAVSFPEMLLKDKERE